jgi:hypothetical protein
MSVVRLYDNDAVTHHSRVGVCRLNERYELAHWVATPQNVYSMLSSFVEPVVVELQEVSY